MPQPVVRKWAKGIRGVAIYAGQVAAPLSPHNLFRPKKGRGCAAVFNHFKRLLKAA